MLPGAYFMRWLSSVVVRYSSIPCRLQLELRFHLKEHDLVFLGRYVPDDCPRIRTRFP